jgi:hypothetical protein
VQGNQQGYDEIKNWKYSIWGRLGSYWSMFVCDVMRVLHQGQDSLHWNSCCEHQRFKYSQEIHWNCRVLVDFTVILYQCEGIPLIDTVCAISALHICFPCSHSLTYHACLTHCLIPTLSIKPVPSMTIVFPPFIFASYKPLPELIALIACSWHLLCSRTHHLYSSSP